MRDRRGNSEDLVLFDFRPVIQGVDAATNEKISRSVREKLRSVGMDKIAVAQIIIDNEDQFAPYWTQWATEILSKERLHQVGNELQNKNQILTVAEADNWSGVRKRISTMSYEVL
jgi:hypothetical protein